MKSFKRFIDEDVRKMPDGGYGVYADKFKTIKTKDGKTKRQGRTPGARVKTCASMLLIAGPAWQRRQGYDCIHACQLLWRCTASKTSARR